jgi:hypothetical protein
VELAEKLARAARVLAAQRSLAATMEMITELALEVVPGVEGAAVSTPDRRAGEVATAGTLAYACQVVQRRLREGPVVDRHPGGDLVLVDLATEQRWPRFGPRARELGVRAVVLCQLPGERVAAGRLTLYASQAPAPGTGQVAALFATHAAVALGHASQVEHLTSAMATRGRIGQAVGLLMHQHDLTGDAAFRLLVRASQQLNVKLRDLAEIVLETDVPPGEAADLARRAAKEAAARNDELRQRRDPGRTSRRSPGEHLTDAQQRTRTATARAIHRLAESAARHPPVDRSDS